MNPPGVCAQASRTSLQRFAKAQPDTGPTRLGTTPGIVRSRLPGAVLPRTGMQLSSPRV